MERETGIEPATNSLEGCDSTTELLPQEPVRSAACRVPSAVTKCAVLGALCANAASGSGVPAPARVLPWLQSVPMLVCSTLHCVGRSAHRTSHVAPSLVVAREGLEPSKPLGRQIYSLLRLTAPQPRQLSVLESSTSTLPCADLAARSTEVSSRHVANQSRPHETATERCSWVQWSWRRDLNPRPAD